MGMLSRTKLTITAAILFVAGASNATAYAAGPDESADSAGTQALLLARETSAYEAWKSKDTGFWNAFLADKFVGWGSSGRLDKTSAAKEYSGADCAIKSFSLSDAQTTLLGRNAALITHKTSFDGACGGQKLPHDRWVASVYVRDGEQWKAAFHAEATIVDPRAPMETARRIAAGEQRETGSPNRDASTDDLLEREKAAWDAWKDRDTKRMDGLIAANVQFINIFGIHLASRAEALKNWSGKGCDVKAVTLTDPAAAMLSPKLGILTFHARADGTCFGQKVGPVWGSSIYVRHGDTWKWTFGINLPARVEAPRRRGA